MTNAAQEHFFQQNYKHGFITQVESIKAQKGINEGVIEFISNKKLEPKWMLEKDCSHIRRGRICKNQNGLMLSIQR